MTEEMNRFFSAMEGFRKINIFDMIPEINRVDFSVLKAVDVCGQKQYHEQNQEVRVSMLVRRLHCRAPLVSRALGSLEAKGLIVRTVDTSDRRNTFVHLTEDGRELIRKVDLAMMDFATEVIQKYGHEEIQDLTDKIMKFHEVANQVFEQRTAEWQKGQKKE